MFVLYFNGRIYRDLKKPKDSDKIQNELVQDYMFIAVLVAYSVIVLFTGQCSMF